MIKRLKLSVWSTMNFSIKHSFHVAYYLGVLETLPPPNISVYFNKTHFENSDRIPVESDTSLSF